MTHKERMLAALRGEPTDLIPYAPRLDLWHRANSLAGTLPDGFRNAPPRDFVDAFGLAYHGVIPNFRDLRDPTDDAERAFGIYSLHMMPFRTTFENVKRTIRTCGDRTICEYDTPPGVIRCVTLYDDAMKRAGISITHVEEYVFKSASDYRALAYLFENARVEPNYEGFAEFADFIGERGIAVGFVSLAATPMHLIQRELMPLDVFFYELHDHPDEVHRLAESIGVYWRRMLDVSADSPADVLLLGANYDASVQYPPFFAEHIAPGLREFARLLHARGKYLLTHTDGENTGLLDHYLASEFDIADSICPKPMTRLSFKEVRDAFAGRITIMGGIPSVTLLQSSMSDRDFDAFLDAFFEDVGAGDHLILGISDTAPPAAAWDSIIKIGERVEALGSVPRTEHDASSATAFRQSI